VSFCMLGSPRAGSRRCFRGRVHGGGHLELVGNATFFAAQERGPEIATANGGRIVRGGSGSCMRFGAPDESGACMCPRYAWPGLGILTRSE
jgi:hypothetical protein